MIEEKGPDVLIRAAGLLRRPDLEVLLIGSQGFARDAPLSPYEQHLRRLAAEAATASGSDIRFEPFVDRIALPDLLRSADVLVVPSRWDEPSGSTAAEGLATGLPVIASRVGGLPDVVGSAGILVAPDDPAALADALATLADDADARQAKARMARAARPRARLVVGVVEPPTGARRALTPEAPSRDQAVSDPGSRRRHRIQRRPRQPRQHLAHRRHPLAPVAGRAVGAVRERPAAGKRTPPLRPGILPAPRS